MENSKNVRIDEKLHRIIKTKASKEGRKLEDVISEFLLVALNIEGVEINGN